MAFVTGGLSSRGSLLLLFLLFFIQAMICIPAVISELSDEIFSPKPIPSMQSDAKGYKHFQVCEKCNEETEEDGLPQHAVSGPQESDRPSTDHDIPASPVRWMRLQRQLLWKIIGFNQQSEDAELPSRNERSKQFDATVRSRYSVWRREYQDPRPDFTLKLLKDQIIMARVYASIANSMNEHNLSNSLMKHFKACRHAIKEATSDSVLPRSSLKYAKEMSSVLSKAKDMLYDCQIVSRKLRAMIQFSEESISTMKRKSLYLTHHATKTISKPLHCLPLQLTTEYFLHDLGSKELPDQKKLDDPSLYHYAIFSDNVLATSVVVNSTILNAKEPWKHVFHIVTDRLNFAAMRMWFILHPPQSATINVENIDDFKWINLSYSSVFRQLGSLKYENPKYLSMLNHLRFYLPELYPKLDKILFLDDDVVVQKDLTQLWSINMKGMVNGAVEICKKDLHRFDDYLNFTNPMISEKFDPHACSWAFGMNIFDLKEWKKLKITGIYHHWQALNKDGTLWKLGSLPPGLVTFYNLTYVLEPSWHVLGLGYEPNIKPSTIMEAAVIHYNGNYKPWMDLAISRHKPYWLKYVTSDDPYYQMCRIDLQ